MSATRDKSRTRSVSRFWDALKTPFTRSLKSDLTSSSLAIQREYSLEPDSISIDQVFFRLQSYFYKKFLDSRSGGQAESLPPPVSLFWEAGRVEPGRPYFFIKRANEIGWLYERSGQGWVVARCEKIVEQNLFMRRNDVWDIVNVYTSDFGTKHHRLGSLKTNRELISFLLYQKISFEEVVSEELQEWPV